MINEDYMRLAAAFLETRPAKAKSFGMRPYPAATAQWEDDLHAVAGVLEADDASFNRELFFAAAGHEEIR